MRHSNRIKKFGRKRNQRTALMRTLTHSLIRDGKIKTTEAKAKALRPVIERLITHAKKNSLASRRLVSSRIGSGIGTSRLFKTIAPKYASRSGGYTRVIKTGLRQSDGARMAVIELV